jgi:perosamine synthetase
MVCTNDDEIAKKVRKIKGQGLAEDKEYWHDLIGYNYRMTNIQAAIGLSQLEKINIILQKKQNILNTYKKYLNKKYVNTQKLKSNCKNGNWMISILTKNSKDRDLLRNFLAEKNIETRPFFYPIHTMKMYKSFELFPVSTMISSKGLNLPSSPNLTENQISYICKSINEFYES